MRREYVFLAVIFLSACATAQDTTLTVTLEATELQVATLDLDALHTQTFATIEALPLIETPTPYLTPTPIGTDYFGDKRNLVSPNGDYVAVRDFTADLDDPYSMRILIIDRNNNVLWTIPFSWGIQVDPHPFISPYRWSNDSSSLFYLEFGGGEGGYEPLYDGGDLWRIDIDSGEITWIIPCSGYKAFEFSNDEQYLAYICQDSAPLEIVVRHQETNEETRWSIPYESVEFYQAGEINWSSSDCELIFFVADTQTYETNLYFLDLLEDELRLISEKLEIEIYNLEEWREDDKIIVVGDHLKQRGLWFEIDLQSGELIAIEPPTPTP